MRMLALPWTAALGIMVSSTGAWAQIENTTCPLVHDFGDSLVVTYDSGLLPPAMARPLNSTCTAGSPCADVTILVDTPLWRDEDLEMEGFRRDVRQLFDLTNDQGVFTNPSIVFTNFGDDSTSARSEYESIIVEEAASAAAIVQVELPD